MTWAPCALASCAYCSCFWIIDSLSPVQVACRSAPRTIRDMRSASSRTSTRSVGPPSGRPPSAGTGPRREGRKDTTHGGSGEPSALLDEELREGRALAGLVELEEEHVVVRPVALAVPVAARARRNGASPVDGPRGVVGLVRAGLVAILQPVRGDGIAAADRVIARVVAVLGVRGEQGADRLRVVGLPGV